MDNNEAEIIAAILARADGGCPVCRDNLAEDMEKKFPGFDWVARARKFDWFGNILPDQASQADAGAKQ